MSIIKKLYEGLGNITAQGIAVGRCGVGKKNRTSNLRFTNQPSGVAQVIEDLGNPRFY